MKKSLFTLALVAAAFAALAQQPAAASATSATIAGTAAAPADAYTAMVTAAITELMNTADPAVLRASAAKMERAAAAKPQDWLPRYYQAYALLITVFQSPKDSDEAKDKTLDQAEAALAQARKLVGADESELLVLQAYIYQARMGVSPVLRGMKYAGMVNETVAQAMQRNPANPRAYLVQANNVYFTPAMFGGGPEVAKPLYQQAQARYAAFKPASSLAPNWGEGQVNGRLKKYETAAVK
ncbi:hypothetical protein [Hymenobacter actinosclerus]|uniref:Uncharacterized protein n=1 Tax=Hymenobacter actinosclerus TaxID=82805 RepID=A0A1I0FEA5_9BACT|nr:hypothetical protein [Hymenobacter actinosclerus]SET55528.1 hypothetical protein SAMN04487998_2201 [Hymenobacter actinosclerus]